MGYIIQYETLIPTLLVVIALGLPLFGIYRLIIWKMNERTKTSFNRFLKIAGISVAVVFFAEITVTLITTHHVNKQLGFNYATPDTPEGEPFEIIRVDPGKTMEKAGLMRYDQVQMFSVSDLYRLLINNQGIEVSFSVLRDKKKIIIRVKVPYMELPLRNVSFLF
jgi:hypothetical protein